MKVTAILAAAIIAGSSTVALAQAGGSGGGAGGAGSDVSTPRKNVQRPTANSPAVNRRGDDMPAGMNQVQMNNSMGMQGEGKMGMHKGKKHMKMAKHGKMKKKEM
jgi:hypothetical protein